jgi:hypothetical protein
LFLSVGILFPSAAIELPSIRILKLSAAMEEEPAVKLDYQQGEIHLLIMNDGRDMAERLAQLLRQREVLREQAEVIAEALAGIGDQIELLRAEASSAGVVLGHDAE